MIASESKHSFRFYSPSSTHSADIGKTVKKMKHSKGNGLVLVWVGIFFDPIKDKHYPSNAGTQIQTGIRGPILYFFPSDFFQSKEEGDLER